MSKQMTKVLMTVALCFLVSSCGGKKTKKKTIDPLNTSGTEQSKGNNSTASHTSSGDTDPTRIEKAELADRLDEAKVFKISRMGIGEHQIIYFPAKTSSRNKLNHDERWYWNNFDGVNADKATNYAYRIYPTASESSGISFSFDLAPYVDSSLVDSINSAGGTSLKFDGENKVTIKCGLVEETYLLNQASSAHGYKFFPKSTEDDYKFDYQSPCSIYAQDFIENGQPEETVEVEPTPGDVADGDVVDNDGDLTDVDNYSCGVTVLVKVRVKGYCQYGKCHTEVTPVVDENCDETSCEPNEPPTCKPPVPVEPPVTGDCDEQTQSCELTGHNHENLVDHAESEPTSELVNKLLPFCSHAKQRTYLRRLEEVQSKKDEIAALAQYCSNRSDNNGLCEAAKIHKLQKKIEAQYKKMHKILNSCQRRQEKDIVKGRHSNPELNTCSTYTRHHVLESYRKQVNHDSKKLAHLEALCKTDGKCKDKKMARISKRIEERTLAITEIEKKCNVTK